MKRVRFEPIDVDDADDFCELYGKLREIMNSLYKNDHDEIIPSIRKMYPIDDQGFPLNPELDNS
jgi:hypothetical protein